MSQSEFGHDLDEHSKSGLSLIDFKGLLMGFSGAAFHHLKQIEKPNHPKNDMNFSYARQNIEILQLLSEKTKGNLTHEEEQVLRQALLDLRVEFIERSKIIKSS